MAAEKSEKLVISFIAMVFVGLGNKSEWRLLRVCLLLPSSRSLSVALQSSRSAMPLDLFACASSQLTLLLIRLQTIPMRNYPTFLNLLTTFIYVWMQSTAEPCYPLS